MIYHAAIGYYWVLEVIYVGYSIITFLLVTSMVLLLFRHREYRKIGLFSITSIPIFYAISVLLIMFYFDISLSKVFAIYCGDERFLMSMYFNINASDFLHIGLIMLGLPVIHSSSLYSWVLNNRASYA